MEILHTLGIDWMLLLAQVVNFLIIMTVLAKFVYKPLLAVIEKRRMIAVHAAEQAEQTERQYKELEQHRTDTLRKTDQEAGALMERAKREAEAMRQEILAAAEKQAEQIMERGERQLAEERSRVFDEVQEVMAKSIIKMTEKIIRREFSKEDQVRLLKTLEHELPALMAS